MKNASLILLLIIPISVFSQWRTFQKNDAFDGILRYSNVVGKGYDRTYDDPTLILRKYEKENSYDLIINNAGYFTTNSKNNILIKFDDEDIFYVTKGTPSIDRDGIFIDRRIYKEKNGGIQISRTQLLQKMMEGSKLTVRIKTDYKTYDMRFTLSGSTKAINYVLPEINEEILKLKKQEEERIKAKIESDRIANLMMLEAQKNLQNNLNIIKRQFYNTCYDTSIFMEFDLNSYLKKELDNSIINFLENNDKIIVDNFEILSRYTLLTDYVSGRSGFNYINFTLHDSFHSNKVQIETFTDFFKCKNFECKNAYRLQFLNSSRISYFKLKDSFLIKNENNPKDNLNTQKWVFFDEDESITLSISDKKNYHKLYKYGYHNKFKDVLDYYIQKTFDKFKYKENVILNSYDNKIFRQSISYIDNSYYHEIFPFTIKKDLNFDLTDPLNYLMIEYKCPIDTDIDRIDRIRNQILNSIDF
jgi:hypothetical protein